MKKRIDWGHLAILALILGWVVWYWMDARKTSLDTENLFVLQPLILVALLLGALVLPQVFRADKLPDELQPEDLNRAEFGRILALMVAYVLFVAAMFVVGFDFAVCIFSAVALYISGERRAWVMLVFSVLSTVLIIKGYQLLVPYPMPMVLL
ncbi:MAG: tripartite tricarboxylate transporter TctB family protein [Burkholderiaceae bacterium]